MKLLNFGILAALAVSAMALGQPDWGQNNNAPGKRMRQRGRKGRKRFRLGTRKPFANRGDLSNSQVSIFLRHDDTTATGFGNLISDQWVITPAHVVHDCDSQYEKDYYNYYDGEWKSTVHDYSCHLKVGVVAQGSDGEGTYQFTKFIVNPNWQEGDVNHDIALLKLDRPVEFSTRVSPICLAKPDLDLTDLDLKISGWLQDQQLIRSYPVEGSVLEESNVIVKSNKDCEYLMNNYLHINTLTENSLCVLPKVGNKGTCMGDLGAPLAYQDEQKHWNLIGFANFGIECGKEEHYMKVENYLDWIKSITGVGAGCM